MSQTCNKKVFFLIFDFQLTVCLANCCNLQVMRTYQFIKLTCLVLFHYSYFWNICLNNLLRKPFWKTSRLFILSLLIFKEAYLFNYFKKIFHSPKNCKYFSKIHWDHKQKIVVSISGQFQWLNLVLIPDTIPPTATYSP